MKLMSCFGEFRKDDRTCEMCEIACNKQYENCKKLKDAKNKVYVFSDLDCPYKYEGFSYSERESYTECEKYGGCCDPETKCKKDIYDKKVNDFNKLKEKLTKEVENL